MTKEDIVYKLLKEILLNIPQNVTDLRDAADKIISYWVNLKFEYPHDLIDNFVYIESSIERLIDDNITDPTKLNEQYTTRYDFHIKPFIESVKELKLFIESERAGSGGALSN
jgi:hypothetical protein